MDLLSICFVMQDVPLLPTTLQAPLGYLATTLDRHVLYDHATGQEYALLITCLYVVPVHSSLPR